MKIAVYAISKNETHFVERFCASAKDADLVLIADTGSADNTVAEAERCGAQVANICITPWRFDLARNAALALLPRDIDVCISLDLDEVLEPGWREEIERVWDTDAWQGEAWNPKSGRDWMGEYEVPRGANTTRLRYFFDWGAGIRFKYEKIHARHGYFFHHPVHEYPRPDGRITEVWAETDKLLVSHHPDPTKSRGQYMDLLELSVKEDPRCPRNAFYHARELTFYSRWPEAEAALKRYLDMPEATWLTERCYAMRLLGKSCEEQRRPIEAESWYHRACAEAPNTREPWCALATLFYRQSRWPDCYAAAMRALAIKDKNLVYTCDPEVWGYQAHDWAAISAWHMGLHDVAREQGRMALDLAPDDARLNRNLRYYLGEISADEVRAA